MLPLEEDDDDEPLDEELSVSLLLSESSSSLLELEEVLLLDVPDALLLLMRTADIASAPLPREREAALSSDGGFGTTSFAKSPPHTSGGLSRGILGRDRSQTDEPRPSKFILGVALDVPLLF